MLSAPLLLHARKSGREKRNEFRARECVLKNIYIDNKIKDLGFLFQRECFLFSLPAIPVA
jgi:hypothetical protein